ncbi:Sulfotransferase family protein [Cognatiyoonia koreensis]|uniref:Sulfotransferase family protein n=1 Tax=Cognatiyoonia koreensis TaxID=364200 RepID=A0A1I0N707_9RHOB|nr:sulfotransferase family 2 domain-containing protein [Cognatiyoonia koreensis]SEV96941.1 Sulfotransferase family protein [Cognatiyoonia koreensis]
MIISPGRNYIFVHAPKTGGTAMALALEDRAMKDDILIGDTPKAIKRRNRLKRLTPKGRLWKHSTLADIEGIISRDQMAGMMVFTLTRNPWDRLVSYYHWLQMQDFDHQAVGLAKTLSFNDFLQHEAILPAFAAQPVRTMGTDGAGTDHLTHLIRLEHWEKDIAPVCAQLGFDIVLTRVNASMRARDYRLYYTAAEVDLVAQACADDIADGGYSFDD